MTPRWNRPALMLCGALALAPILASPIAAAPPQKAKTAPLDPLASLIAMEQRVAPIIQRLAVRNARWCPVTMAMPGWLLGDSRLYRKGVWSRAQVDYSASDADAPFIAALDPSGPAAGAGLRIGDPIIAIGGTAAQGGSSDPHARMANAHALLAAHKGDGPITVTMQQGRPVTFVPARGCASEFRVEATESVQAKADGLLVLISAGMVRFADDDDELATVIAHELAHNILRHRARLDAAAITRGLGQFFGRNARLTRVTEEEADRLSVWLLVGAGYDPTAAARFWTNYGKRHGGGIFQSPTHPTWRQRVKLVTAETMLVTQMRAADPAAAPPMIANPAILD